MDPECRQWIITKSQNNKCQQRFSKQNLMCMKLSVFVEFDCRRMVWLERYDCFVAFIVQPGFACWPFL